MRKRRQREREQREKRRWEFPERIGSHCNYVSPALEFAKLITNHVFGLDEAFYDEARMVKSNLLRMIHCKEFSKEATEGLEPSLVLVVPDVTCESCLSCFDLDICRDPSLNATVNSAHELGNSSGQAPWLCHRCDAKMSKDEIERRLLELVNRRLVSYQMQDLSCLNCRMVKNSLVSAYCECTGAYKQTQGNVAPEKLKSPNLLNE